MSIARDIRSYADNAVSQGKQVLDTAQAQLNDVTGQATDLYGKTRENVTDLADKATTVVQDLRTQAEKAINLDAIKTAVEPYLIQVKGYTHSVTDRAEVLLSGVKGDKRVAKLVDAAGTVVETVQDRVVKPVLDLAGRAPAPAPRPAAAPTTSAPTAAKAAATKPAAKPAGTRAASTTKPASKPAARKAPAKRTSKA